MHRRGHDGGRVGAVLGVPSVTHAFGGALPASFVAAAGSRLEPLWAEYGQTMPPYAGCFASGYLDICPAAVQTVDTTHIPVRQPLRPVQDIGESPSELPEGGPPLVYLTLGTVFNHLGVFRAAVDALSELPIRLLVAVGPSGDPLALDPLPSNVWVRRWVNQAQVLGSCQVVVSHGGSGTFLGALAHGLPQLCLPQAADQFRNSEGGVDSGAALALSPDESGPESIRRAANRLLTEDSFRLHARRVAAEIHAMPSPAEVVEALQRLV